MSIALKIIGLTISEWFSLLGGLIVFGFLFGLLERETNSRMIRTFGIKGIYFTAWLGTPIHELSHVVMCLVFRHKVTEVKLFQAIGPDGTIGYVRHTYRPDRLYQRIGNLFIGIAPLIGGSLSIAFCARLFLSSDVSLFSSDRANAPLFFSLLDLPSWVVLWKAVFALFQSLFVVDHFSNVWFWAFMLIALCVSSRMSLSPEDIRGAQSGTGALLVLFLIVNTLSSLLDHGLYQQMMHGIARLNFIMLLMLSLSLFFAFLIFLISSLLEFVIRYIKRRNS
ncbi:hypothetical protein NIE32_09555 [Sporolactobacillus kofuensis]|nr:hypothetical protein [Sporolactobacillus kofuensis]